MRAAVVFALSWFAITLSAQPGPSYFVTDLGFAGIPFSVNENRQVAGRIDAFPNSRAFLYDAGSVTDFNTLFAPGVFSEARGIDLNGLVAGYSNSNGHPRAFRYVNGVITNLDPFPGGSQSYAFAVNDSGQVVGAADGLGILQHATLWQNGVLTDLGTLPGGRQSWAQGINSSGQITGYGDTFVAGTQFFRAFLLSNGAMTTLTFPCGGEGQGSAINNLGQVTGYSGNCVDGNHAFLYSNGTMTDLGTLGGTASYGMGINDLGQVTGTSYTASLNLHAFLYSGGVMRDLNDLIAPNSGWVLTSGQAINGSGQIAGFGLFFGSNRAFLLTSTSDSLPPTTTLVQSPAPNSAGWNNSSVTISLTASDNQGGSGVSRIRTSLTGAQTGDQSFNGSSASLLITSEGVTTLTWSAVDATGNEERPKSVTIRIDRTVPTVAGLPATGCMIWPPDKRLVQFTITASDGLSGLASLAVSATSSEPVAPGDIVISGGSVQLRADRDGSSIDRVYTLSATASDVAGNVVTSTGTCVVPHDQSH